MSGLSVVTFHTAPPLEVYYSYQEPPYRDVIGFSANGTHLWTPRAAGEAYQSEEYELDADFAQSLEAFFAARFKNPDLAYNCHMAAAGMRGLVNWSDEPTARRYALDILPEDWYEPQGPLDLKVGRQGIYHSGSRLEHSVVGLSPDEHIQLNGTNEPYISILPAQYNHEYSFRTPGVKFFPG